MRLGASARRAVEVLDGLLAGMRDTVERTLSTAVGIRARTRSRTSTGGSSYTWTLANTVTGRFMATGNREMEFAAKMGVSATHVCILPYNTAVSVDDRLEVGGVEYSVVGVMEHTDPVLVKVLCARVEE